jgi:outer membrane protein OmpA-like peptidoglycan-associated protein
MKNYLIIFLMLLNPLCLFSQTGDSVKVYFRLNKAELTNGAKHKIDAAIKKGLISSSQSLVITGYADYLASSEYNLALSQRRADSVKLYLISLGFKPDAIRACVGKGKINRDTVNGKLGYAPDRKVVITLDQEANATAKSNKPAKDITQLKTNETLVLDNIYFLPGRHVITEASKPTLEHLYEALKAHPNIKIRIEGHICCSSEGHDDGFDYDFGTYELSTNRARAIYDYLVDKGIDPNRLDYKGFAKTHPLVDPERTPDDENRNRRVEIRITAQ